MSDFWIGLITVIYLFAVGVIGLGVVFGFGGILDVGHGIYFAAGAYFVLLFNQAFSSVPLLLPMLLAVGFAALVALVVGILLLRVAGLYFALASLALAVSAQAFLQGSDWAGSFLGVGGTSRDLLGFGNVGQNVLYVLAAGSAIVCIWLLGSFRKSRDGRAVAAVRTLRPVAESLGVDSGRLRLKRACSPTRARGRKRETQDTVGPFQFSPAEPVA